MKNCCRYLWIFGVVYTLGIWGFSAYYFHSQVRQMEEEFKLAHIARRLELGETGFILCAAPFLEKGFYYNNQKAAAVCNGMSSYYLKHRAFDKALLWSHWEERILKKTAQNAGMLFFTYSDLSWLYLELNNVKKAKDYILKANQYLDKYRSAQIYGNVKIGEFYYLYGKILFKEKQYSDAVEFFHNGAKYFEKSREKNGPECAIWRGASSYFIGKCYFALGDYKQAGKYADDSCDFLMETKVPERYFFKCYLLQYQIYERTGNRERAEKYRHLLLGFDENTGLDMQDYESINILGKQTSIQ